MSQTTSEIVHPSNRIDEETEAQRGSDLFKVIGGINRKRRHT